jgi:4-alpha-glucanotransferase
MGRSSGVTIPLFSLRTRTDWGIGQISDLPACAAWLARAGQRLVQVLPTQELADGETSPYGALSAFALDPIYVAVDRIPDLDEQQIATALGDGGRAELEYVRNAPRVDYRVVRSLKRRAFAAAFGRFRERELAKGTARARDMLAFVEKESAWLRDHALYAALRRLRLGYGWMTWPEAERDRAPNILAHATDPRDDGALGTRVLEEMYLQWIAHEQWRVARDELRALGVALMGDMPFIVGRESADVWARRSEFLLDVSLGAPPDAFTQEGQSWGLPAYDWRAMDANDLSWLRARARHAAVLFDRFRIDHLVGFFRQWVQKDGEKGRFTPAEEKDQHARGQRVLRAMIDSAGPHAVIAEDLGVIPPFVRDTMKELGVPGYKVLPWERDGNFMPFDPRTYPELSVATWSTHDTAPITGWWDQMEHWERERLAALDRIPLDLSEHDRELALLKLLFTAKSELTLVLVNELLGDKSRINVPGTVTDSNWSWRLPRPVEELRDDSRIGARFDEIRGLVSSAGRLS